MTALEEEPHMTPSNAPSEAICIRAGKAQDIPFLALIDEMACTPPFEYSLWDPVLDNLGTSSRSFLEAFYECDASNWGGVDDFLVLEFEGTPAGACAVYAPEPHSSDYRVLRLDRLPAVAAKLGWDGATFSRFRDQYEEVWGPAGAVYSLPQAACIIETLAVLPEYRGKGLARNLLNAAFDKARNEGRSSIGIMAILGNEPALRPYGELFSPYITYHSAFFDDQFPGIAKFRRNLALI